ncbi:MAG TPA: CrcB family protein [Candidatus Nitrosotalea sp.]|nr:CrcB family protein [Candidatus Nitrosotalea sp.]
MRMIELAFLAAGGVAGVFVRYGITKSPLVLGALPVNVLIVNVIGSFILGVFAVLSLQWNLDQKYAMLVALGFCGGLTTMSSFALEASNMLDNKQYLLVAANILTNVGLSLGAIFGGKALAGMMLEGGLK